MKGIEPAVKPSLPKIYNNYKASKAIRMVDRFLSSKIPQCKYIDIKYIINTYTPYQTTEKELTENEIVNKIWRNNAT